MCAAKRAHARARATAGELATRKREHSRKPDEQYDIIEAAVRGHFSNCSQEREEDRGCDIARDTARGDDHLLG